MLKKVLLITLVAAFIYGIYYFYQRVTVSERALKAASYHYLALPVQEQLKFRQVYNSPNSPSNAIKNYARVLDDDPQRLILIESAIEKDKSSQSTNQYQGYPNAQPTKKNINLWNNQQEIQQRNDCQNRMNKYNACMSEYNAELSEYNTCITEKITDPTKYCWKPSNLCFKPYCN